MNRNPSQILDVELKFGLGFLFIYKEEVSIIIVVV